MFITIKTMDIVTLGSLCVDIVLSVPVLPQASDEGERPAFFEQLVVAQPPPDQKFWEAGGNCNLVIAASRLGLRVSSVGHLGDDTFGHFLLGVLQSERINVVQIEEDSEETNRGASYGSTLLCWVFVDPHQNHEFFSNTGFSEGPVLGRMTNLPKQAVAEIQQSKILFCDGYVFDEISPDLVVSALNRAIDAGTTIFFDPGPAGKDLATGTPAQKNALDMLLRLTDVLLLTSDEAESLTGIKNAVAAGYELIKKGGR
ncbi:uncharacterized protein A4U43_C02F21640 [Asparagus officinalis]|uniref:Carbohydrate kinase PfkB domain-containing protein n=1 Tax=Asparagus officinalis TaxID=4686 RepID=A0A5P1FPU3_ASPOF|nr:uncharacterized protein A4U43_C02F21640 [Asparagus officinalis]